MKKSLFSFLFFVVYSLQAISQNASFTTSPAATNNVLSLCEGSQVLFTSTAAGTINSINWTFQGGNPSSSNALGPHIVTFANPGTYTVSSSVNGGPTTTMQVIIQASNPSPNLNLNLDLVNCTGFGSSTFNGVTYFTSCTQGSFNGDYLCLTTSSTNTNVNSVHTIFWGDGTSNSYTGSNNTNPGFGNQVSAAGGSFITYTLQQNSNSCVSSQLYPVYAGSNPTALVSPGGIPVLCNPSSVTYNIIPGQQNTPGTTYTVSFNDGSTPVVFNHPPPASFQHVYNSVSCGTNSLINGITYQNSFQASITAQNVCGSSSNAIGPINIQSAPEAQMTTTPNLNQYNNKVCQGSSVTFNDNSTPGTNISTSNNSITCNNSYKRIWRLYGPTGLITASNAQVNITGSMGSVTSLLNYGSWPPINLVNQNISVQFLQPGNYCMVLYVAGLAYNPCGADSTTICLCVTPDFQVNITSPFVTACAPASGVFENNSTPAQCNLNNVSAWSVTSSNPNQCGQPAWSFNNNTNAQSLNSSIAFTGPGVYTVQLTSSLSSPVFSNTTPLGCQAKTTSTQVTIKAPPLINLSAPSSICLGSPFNPTATVNNCYSTQTPTYSWNFNPNNSISPANVPTPTSASTLNPGTITYPNSGTFPFSLTATNECGPTTVNQNIIVQNPATVNPGSYGPFCSNTPVVLSGNVTGGVSNGYWTANVAGGSFSAVGSGGANTGAINSTYSPPNNYVGSIILTLTSVQPPAPCPVVSGQTTVVFDANAWANASSYPNGVCAGQAISLNGTFGGAASSITWTSNVGGTFSNPNSATSTWTPPVGFTGNAVLTLTTNDPAGPCNPATSTATIQVKPLPVATSPTSVGPICSGSNAVITVTSSINPSTFNWTATIPSGVVATASGSLSSGSNSATLTTSIINNTNAPQTVVYIFTPTANGCPGIPDTTSVVVQPVATVGPFSPITVCPGATITAPTFVSNPTGSTFAWTNNNIQIGLVASGNGQIAPWTAPVNTNNNTPGTITGTINVTPTFNNCPGTPASFLVTVNPTPTITNTSLTQTICSGANTVAVTWAPSTTGTTFAWTGVASAGSVTGFTASGSSNLPSMTITNSSNTVQTVTYTITPTRNGCSGPPITYTITVNPTPVLTLSPNQTICGGQTTVATTNTNSVAGGTFSYTLQNSSSVPATLTGYPTNGNGQIPAATINNSGISPYTLNYTVTPTANNCSGTTGTYSITVNPAPVTTFSQGNQTICTGQNTTLVNLSSTTSGVSFSWNLQGAVPAGLGNFNPTSGTSNIPAYTNLTNSTTSPITVTLQAQATTSGLAQCPGAPVNYSITVNPSPIVTTNFVSNDTVCSGQNINIALSSTTTGTSFTWTATNGSGVTGGQNSSSPSATINQVLSNSSNAVGNVTYSITPSASSCTGNPVQIIAYVNPVATVGPFSPITVCPGATITAPTFVSNPTGSTFAWTNNNIQIGLVASGNGQIAPWTAPVNTNNNTPGTITGTINVTPTFNNCPGTPASFLVTVNPTPTITNTSLTQTICSGANTVAVTWAPSTTGTTFAWTGVASAGSVTGFTASGSSNLPSMTITNSSNTVQTVTYTITPTRNGCSGPPITYTITVNPTPVLTLSPNQTICGGQTTVATTNTNSVAGGTFSYTLQNSSSVPATLTGYPTNGNGQIPAATINNSGISPYTLNYTVTPTANNCSGTTGTYSITVNPAPVTTFAVANQSICSGTNTVAVALNSTTPNVTFAWQAVVPAGISNVNSVNGSGNIPVFTNLTNSTNSVQTIQITATASTSGTVCAGAPAPYSISVIPIPIANQINDATFCNNSNVPATPLSSNIPTSTFSWAMNPSIGLTPASGTSSTIPAFNASINVSNPVSSTVTITPTVSNGGTSCLGTPSSFTITINPIPSVTPIAAQVICSGATSNAITITGPVNGTTYTWNNNNTNSGLGSSGSVVIPSVQGTNTTNSPISSAITIVPTFTNNSVTCTGVNSTYTFTVNPIPTIAALPNQQVCSGNSVALNFTSLNNINGTVYNWTNNNTAIGLGASGVGNISFASTNTTNGPISANIIVTPAFSNGGVACPGLPDTIQITILPTPIANALSPQVICASNNSTAINFGANASGTLFTWTNTNAAIGLTTSGNGNIPVFTTTNNGVTSISGTISAIPSLTTNGQACQGAPVTTQITINPNPIINIPASASYCHGSIGTFNFTSNITNGVTYAWTNTNNAIGLGSAGSGNISFTAQNITNAPISGTVNVIPTYTANGLGCSGTAQSFNFEVIPNPAVNAQSNITLCTGQPSSAISFTSPVSGTTFAWTNSNTSIGLGASGNGDIPTFNAINSSNSSPLTAQVSVTASVTVNNVTCTGFPMLFNITINPNTTVNPVNNSTICAGSTSSQFNFSGTGTSYTWTNSNSAIGLVSNGTGNIAPFVATNSGITPITGNLNVTSVFSGGGISCNGSTTSFSITVNPTPVVTAPSNLTLCNGATSNVINLVGTGTSYNWTNSNPSIGLAASGSGDIPSFVAVNNTSNPIIATINITPTFGNNNVSCPGIVQSFTITVNPAPQVTFDVPNQTICSGTSTSLVNISSATSGAVISWNATSVPASISGINSASGGNSIPSYTLLNTSLSAQTVQFTVNVATGGAVACPGGGVTYNITVNPAPTMTPAANQVLCPNATTSAVNFTGNANVYNWSNNNTSIGLGSFGSGNIPSFTALNNTANVITSTITVTPQFLNNNVGCNGVPTTFTITVNPTPTTNPISNQTICNGANSTALTITGNASSYAWTNSNQAIGLVSSGTNTIPVFVGTNSTNSPISGTITITPTFTNAGVSCTGTNSTYLITVNPTPTANSVSDQTVCNNSSTSLITFNGNATSFNWANNNTSIGLASSGTGNIGIFTAINTSNSTPSVANISVTPIYTNNSVSCQGVVVPFTFTVNPTPVLSPPTNQVVCNGASTSSVLFSGTGTQYNWTNNTTSIGLAASGSGNINAFTASNATINPVTAQISVTPIYSGNNLTCSGTSQSFSITVNPSPSAIAPTNQVVCNGQTTAAVNFSGTATSYSWSNDLTSIGLVANGNGNISAFNAVNNTNAPVTANIVVQPIFTGTNLNCPGISQSFTITVNPTPNMGSLTNQVLCAGSSTDAVNFTGTATNYAWSNNTPGIGLVGSGNGNIASFTSLNTSNSNALTGTINVTPQYVNAGITCSGPIQQMTITVNPTPIITANPNLTYCHNSQSALIAFSGTGSTHSWTNSNTAIGLLAGGNGNIAPFTATNPGVNPISGTISVTPVFNGNGISCNGNQNNFTITINPTPSVDAVNNQIVCNGSSTAAIAFSGNVSSTSYNWTNSATSIGLGASGTGNISAFNAINNGNNPVVAQINVTPVFTNNNVACSGTIQSFTITVNATPTVNFSLANQTICSQSASNTVNISSPTNGAVISWSVTNLPAAITGLNQNTGASVIPSFTLDNNATTPQIVTISASATTPGNVACPGGGTIYNITVNPNPLVTPVANQVVCHNTNTSPIVFSGTGTSYTWVNSSTTAGLAASGIGNISGFTALNSSNSVIETSTITVTPQFTNNNVTCPGSTETFTITVNPIPVVNALSNLTFCNGTNTNLITLSGTGTSFAWTNSNTSIGLASSGTGIIAPFPASNTGTTPLNATIGVIPSFTNAGVTCVGSNSNSIITVNPTPTVNSINNQVICSNTSTTAIVFSGTGTSYNWTNSTPSIGLANIGIGNIPSFIGTNTSNSNPITATISVTPQYLNNAVNCSGPSSNFTITVNPIPNANAPISQTLCNGATTTQISFSGTGTSYNWTNSINTIGIGSTGTGNINPFTAVNNGLNPITSQLTVIPVYTGDGISCFGSAQNFSITINPTPTVQIPSNQVICNGNLSQAVNFSGNGTSYSWNNSNTSIGLGSSGNGNIASFITTNTSQIPISGTITVTPNFAGGSASCPGSPQTFTFTVNPTPIIDPLSSQVLCNNTSTQSIAFSGTGTSYTWTNNAIGIGLGASGTGNIAAFTASNASNSNALVATLSVTPQYLNGGITCSGNSQQMTITVNPTPIVNPINNVTICNQSNSPVLNFAGTGTTYNWTNNNNTIGLVSSGTGLFLPTFQATNGSTQSVNSLITVSPEYSANGVSCAGTSTSFTIFVSPTPTVTAPSNQIICNGSPTNAVVFNGVVPNTTYNWTNNISTIGIPASGSGNISSFNAINNGNSAQFAQVTVTPTFIQNTVSCPGTPQSFTFQINPTPSVTNPGSQYVCANSTSSLLNFTGTGTQYQWIAANPSIGIASSGNNSISPFIGLNTSNSVVSSSVIVTPIFFQGISCSGQNETFTFYILPIPSVAPINDQSFCNQASVPATTINGSGTSYNWTNSNTSIGLVSAGSNIINAFNATNPGTQALVGNVAITPIFTFQGQSCNGPQETYDITINPTPYVNNLNDTIICNNNLLAVNITTNIPSNVTWSATQNNNVTGELITTQTSNFINDSLTNTSNVPQFVNYSITPTTNQGCIGPDSFFVAQVQPNVVLNIPQSIEICSGAGVNAVLAANIPSTFSWFCTINNPNVTGESILTNTGAVINDILVNTSNQNQVVVYAVTPTSIQGNCQGPSQTITVIVKPPLALLNEDTVTICSNEFVNLNLVANTAVTFNWYADPNVNVFGESTNITSASVINDQLVNPTGAVELVQYHVIGTSLANGCSSPIIPIWVFVNPTPAITPNSDLILCHNQSQPQVVFNGTAYGSSYWWNATGNNVGLPVNAGIDSLNAFVASNLGFAPITSTIVVSPLFTFNGLSCPGVKDTFQIIVNPQPSVFALNNLTLCEGTNSQLVNILGPIGGTTFSWTNSNAAVGLSSTGTGNIPSFLANNPTLAPIQSIVTVTPLFINGGVQCQGQSTSFNITVNPAPNVDTINLAICPGENVNQPLSANLPSTFTWVANPNPLVINETSNPVQTSNTINDNLIQTTNIPQTVQYNIVATSLAHSCVGNGVVNVVVNPWPTVAFTALNPPYCDLTPIAFQNNSIGTYDYLWQFGDGTNSYLENPTHQFPAVGSFNVTLVATDPLTGCIDSTMVPVNISPSPNPGFSYSDSIGCGLLDVVFTADVYNPTWNYQWSFGDGATTQQVGQVGYQYGNAGCYDISLSVTNQQGCTTTETYFDGICIYESPVALIGADPTWVTTFNPFVQFSNSSVNATSYEWNFGDGTNGYGYDPSHVFPSEPADYLVSMIALNEVGCSDTAYINIHVEQTLIYYVPNTFTPNNDEKNQVFKPILTEGYKVGSYLLRIYNRWGEIVFESRDQEIGWDGSYGPNSINCQTGTYTWVLNFQVLQTQEDKEIVGHVNLIK